MLSIECRPNKFSEVIGQDLAVRTLKSIATSPGISVRSIVLQGSYGCGKTTLSRIFAKAVVCDHISSGDVCLECPSCKEASRDNSSCYLEFDASRVGNVEAIKSLIDRLSISVSDKRRVVCIDEVHTCSNQALNALLKVLEEGIPNTFFVFSTTEPLLKTIMSRSCVIPITTVNHITLAAYVKEVATSHEIIISDEQIDRLTLKSEGHVRNAMQLLDHFAMVGDEAIKTPYNLISKIILQSIRNENISTALSELELYPLPDVRQSLNLFLRNTFLGKGAFESKLLEKQLAPKIFQIFYSPEVREALKDEYGILIAFRYFNELLNENR